MSNVTSKPLDSAPRARKPHMVSADRVVGITIAILRFLAILLIISSAFGNYVQFVGGWNNLGPLNAVALGLAIGYQALCSVLQWGFKALRWWPLYAFFLLASAIPSFLTYNAWAGPYFMTQFGPILAIGLIGIAVIAADALPEWVLVG
jgi:hypothetical protein